MQGAVKEVMRFMEENERLRKRVVAWLLPEQIENIETVVSNENMKNYSEFISKAVDFYYGYLGTKDSTSFLADNLQTVLKGTVQTMENRMANSLFRLTVEMSMMMNVIANGLELEESYLEKMRTKCVREIKKSRGKVAFEVISDIDG